MSEQVGILGAGSLGTLLATRLAKAGHAVRVLARSPERRVALQGQTGIRVLDDPRELTETTLVFFCVKAYDTETAAAGLGGLPTTTGICSLQNGWGNLDALNATLPGSPLVAGATTLGAYLDETGSLQASTSGSTVLAPWEGTEYRWAEYAAGLLDGAGLRSEPRREARPVLWRKLVLNAAVNPLSALTGRPNGAILESDPLRRIAESAAEEGTRVGIGLGFLEPDYDPVPPLLALLEETRTNRSSMAEDLAHTRRTEIDSIVGSIVSYARNGGEKTPVLEALWILVRAAEATLTAPESAS